MDCLSRKPPWKVLSHAGFSRIGAKPILAVKTVADGGESVFDSILLSIFTPLTTSASRSWHLDLGAPWLIPFPSGSWGTS